ncbi:hypothetical protein SEA_ZAGIE_92 [Microbacterium phage Zagie]|nr:hypothetical protein SEA_TEEHEE_91 [Microbacterium phage Teehee]QXN73485.1 hypothetical protein SEA_JEHOSHAPHAT_92 [Microbacterium phage Jehoshaphat]UVG35445.1 hypothetical protein SEA_ZAGIE_92 [Microbacterium phage Zagie]WKW84958.1 hypothetical protein SEA_SALLYK_92 [Microbacterium phage SallyK]
MNVSRIESTLDDGKSPDFDHVLMLIAVELPDGSLAGYVIEQVGGSVWDRAPEVSHSEEHDVEINGMPRGVYPWDVLTGNSGQHGYTGAVMHPSELWSQCHVDDLVRLADHPGHALLFTCVVVNDNDHDDVACGCNGEECEVYEDDRTVGWAVAYKLVD